MTGPSRLFPAVVVAVLALAGAVLAKEAGAALAKEAAMEAGSGEARPGTADSELAGSGAPGAACRRTRLEESLPRAMVAVQSPSGSEMVLAAFDQHLLVRVSLDGRVLGKAGGGEAPILERVSSVKALPEGYLVLAGVQHLLRLDGDLRLQRQWDFRPAHGAPELPDGVRALFVQDAVLFGGDLFAYGFLLREEDARNQRRVFRLSPGVPPALEGILEEVPAGDPGAELQGRALPLLASTEEGVYMLRLAARPHLLEVYPEARRLEAFPAGFEELPSLPESRNRGGEAAYWKAVERAAVPSALFARGGSLFVLTRRPRSADESSAGTRWQLARIDPKGDRLLGTLELPTSVPQLVAVPGPEQWIFLEKGSLTASGEQPTESLFSLPATTVEGISGALDAPACR